MSSGDMLSGGVNAFDIACALPFISRRLKLNWKAASVKQAVSFDNFSEKLLERIPL